MTILTKKKLGEILIEEGLINSKQLNEALEDQKLTGDRVGEILVRKGWVSHKDLKRVLSLQTGIATIDLSDCIIEFEILKLVPEEFSRKYKLMPIFLIENTLAVAMASPTDVFIIDELQKMTKYRVEPVFAEELEIKKIQDQYYVGSGSLQEIIASIDKTKLSEGEKLGEEAPIIKIVNYLIIQAIQCRASDIHVEPEEKLLNIRYRIDGMLQRQPPLPRDLSLAIISRLKIMANLDIAEKRLPQDGRILMKVANKEIDFRVSTCPTIYGENVVIRILDKAGLILGLEALGFPTRELKLYKELINSPYGIFLVTGPTGSGKTTTLYSSLQLLNKEGVNIMTVEDPIEYQFPGMRQVAVNPMAGLTFASTLRSFLRQDPDIIMVGEIRDRETAEIAVQAALTGHLVFSTLHTNDAPTAFTRLVDMGVEPFLISSSIIGVLAQRLVRKICDKCKEGFRPSQDMLKSLGLEDKIGQNPVFYKGKGCKVCSSTGYKGRIGIYELLKVTPKIQELVLKKASADEIRTQSLKEGLINLRQAAIEKLFSSITTVDEVTRVTLENG
jgi:type IV pilus assembly protein PilB